MTREETSKILAVIQAAYPNYNPPNKTVVVNIWHMMLGDFTYEQVAAAVYAFIRTNKKGFAPSIGEIVDKLQMLFGDDDDENEGEAWDLVMTAIGKSGYYSNEEFYKLPELVQKVIGSPNQLRNWALSETFNESVESSNFKKAYRVEKQREAEVKKLPPNLKKIIESKKGNTGKMISSNQAGIAEDDLLSGERKRADMPEHLRDRLKEAWEEGERE